MPDHGIRLPTNYSSMAIGILGQHPYGWAGTPPYRAQDMPTNNWFAADSFAYERIDWEKFVAQSKSTGQATNPWNLSNPPFLSSGSQIGPKGPPSWMQQKDGGGTARILRGYLRRSTVDPAEPASFARLYFMWNPGTLIRQYMSTIDVGGIDPTGMQGIESPDAPSLQPQTINFGFELYFDRETECAVMKDHPGVLVDLQAFDAIGATTGVGTRSGLKVSQKDLSVPALGSTEPPPPDVANVDMVAADEMADFAMRQNIFTKPVLITAVFSPSLAFYGILDSAEATFEKFTSRMTPTRMTLSIVMRLFSVGKLTNQTMAAPDTSQSGTVYNPGAFDITKVPATQTEADKANAALRANMASWALQWDHKVQYNNGSLRPQGAPCEPSKTTYFDCSSLVNRAFRAVGADEKLGLTGVCSSGGPGTAMLVQIGDSRPDVWQTAHIPANPGLVFQKLQMGDIILHGGHPGHVVIFMGFTETGSGPNGAPDANVIMSKKVIRIMQAAYPDAYGPGIGVGATNKSGNDFVKDGHTHIMRAAPIKTAAGAAVAGGGS